MGYCASWHYNNALYISSCIVNVLLFLFCASFTIMSTLFVSSKVKVDLFQAQLDYLFIWSTWSLTALIQLNPIDGDDHVKGVRGTLNKSWSWSSGWRCFGLNKRLSWNYLHLQSRWAPRDSGEGGNWGEQSHYSQIKPVLNRRLVILSFTYRWIISVCNRPHGDVNERRASDTNVDENSKINIK